MYATSFLRAWNHVPVENTAARTTVHKQLQRLHMISQTVDQNLFQGLGSGNFLKMDNLKDSW
jgi:hypothetical protein